MAALTPHNALAAIEKGRLAPLYWIFGEEAFFTDRLLGGLKKAAVTAAPDFNFDRFDAAAAAPHQVLGAASSHPVLAPRRLVLVKGAEAYRADDLERITAYAERPLETTTLVFVSSKKPDLRRKLFKAIDKVGGLIDCKPIWPREVGLWVTRMARERGFGVDPAAVEVLFEYIGTDLLALDQTVDKATLLAEGEKRVSEVLAREAVALSRHGDIFEIFDATIEGRAEVALQGLGRLLANGESVVALLAGFFWQFRRLWLAAELAAQGRSRPEIAASLAAGGRAVPRFILDRLARQVRRFPAERCRAVAERFYRLDRLAKGGSHFPEIHLERLVLEMVR